MYKFMRFFNQNRKTIYKFVLIVVFVLLIIKLFNTAAYQQRQSKVNNINSSNFEKDNKTMKNTAVISNESAIDGSQVDIENLDLAQRLIHEFVNYCNQSEIEKAYDLIGENCKNELFKTVEEFKADYYDVIFDNELKMFSMENWIGNTYKVDIFNDALSTGSIADEYTDFITIVKQNNKDDYKLNIKRYIGKRNINKETEIENIRVKVLCKNVYMDYEVYDIEIFNDSENDILMDTKDDTKTVYLKDNKGARYFAFTNEVNDSEFIVRKGKTKNFSLKFSNDYGSSKKVKNLIFSKCILNYKVYEQLENKDQYKEYYEFIINI